MNRAAILTLLGLALATAPAAAQAKADTAFHALQMRGRLVMGVDQYTSTHVFEDLADGGRIELQRDTVDPEGVTVIRAHLKTIAQAFKAGDFTAPALVHLKEVAGVAVLTAKKSLITYRYRDLPRGGEVRIQTSDPAAVKAVHAFLKFQRSEHHAH